MPARSVLLLTLCLLLPGPFVQAQADASCGVVDAIGYPVDGLAAGYDDFGLHRRRFGGNHVGIDLAFDRWGDPVRAAMRGIVTYSDVAGWDSEKGVVIVAHRMPDDSQVYTLYGHMEQFDELSFPRSRRLCHRANGAGRHRLALARAAAFALRNPRHPAG